MAHSVKDAMTKMNPEKENFIIGGASVYRDFLPFSQKLYLTKVDASFPDADTFFPEIKESEWKIIEEEKIPANEKNEFAHTFLLLERKKAPHF
jgi:dihydrofolate reductase